MSKDTAKLLRRENIPTYLAVMAAWARGEHDPEIPPGWCPVLTMATEDRGGHSAAAFPALPEIESRYAV
jgi:hypothetical protein